MAHWTFMCNLAEQHPGTLANEIRPQLEKYSKLVTLREHLLILKELHRTTTTASMRNEIMLTALLSDYVAAKFKIDPTTWLKDTEVWNKPPGHIEETEFPELEG